MWGFGVKRFCHVIHISDISLYAYIYICICKMLIIVNVIMYLCNSKTERRGLLR